LAIIGRPCFFAADLFAKRTMAAPSLTCDEFPPVELPSFLNAGFNFDNFYMLESFLIPSSYSTLTLFIFPSLSLT